MLVGCCSVSEVKVVNAFWLQCLKGYKKPSKLSRKYFKVGCHGDFRKYV